MEESDKARIQVLFFAKSKELTGLNQASIQVRSGLINENELLDIIVKEFPAINILREHLILAVNQVYLEKDSTTELFDGLEIAVIPPISGG